jgi:hypothetical protein
MKQLAIPTPPALLVAFLVTGCDMIQLKPDPAESLENYFRQESTLSQTGWRFYATEEKADKLHAYLEFPSSSVAGGRSAPVETELRYLCPDSSLHHFWKQSDYRAFELYLLKNIQRSTGKAKLLVQVTCDAGFDLIAYEQSTLEPSKPEVEPKSEPLKVDEADRSAWYESMLTALREDNISQIQKLMVERQQYIDIKNDREESLLHLVKSAAAARVLLNNGASIEAKTSWGATPLIYVADYKNAELVSVLIDAGADVNYRDRNGATPLNQAWSLEVVELLVERGAEVPEDALIDPAGLGKLDMVTFLYRQGARIDKANGRGTTALHRAASKSSETNASGQLEVARWLLQNGADVNALDVFGKTPYDATIWGSNPNQEMLRLLSSKSGKPGKELIKN